MTEVLHTGSAAGGLKAAQEALSLWADCATGNANSSQLPGGVTQFVRLRTTRAAFDAAASLLLSWPDYTNDTAWRKAVRVALKKAAGNFLAACEEIEGSNRAEAWFEEDKEVGSESFYFHWEGSWTKGRRIRVQIALFTHEPEVYLDWCTGTGQESKFLALPSSTDEVFTGGRGGAGWVVREPSKIFNAEAT